MVYQMSALTGGWDRWRHCFQQRLLPWLLPWRCVACGGPGGVQLPIRQQRIALDLCADCYAQLPINERACLSCASPLSGDDLVCGQCQQHPPAFHRAFCALRYEYPAAQLIRQLKYAQGLAQSRALATLLAHYLLNRHTTSWPQCIVPVPLYHQRFRTRGYNQASELGKHLAALLNLSLRTDLVQRHRHTPVQAGLARRQRRRNVRGAFRMIDTSLPPRIALLDDVVTTGSTLNELSRLCIKHGAVDIEIWGIARVARQSIKV